MSNFLEQYGKSIFVLVLITILIAFASPLGKMIKDATTKQVNQTEEIGDDEIYTATTGRPKPPKTAVDRVWAYIDAKSELVISQTKIESPNTALVSAKQVNCFGLVDSITSKPNMIHTVRFANAVRPKTCKFWFKDCTNLTEIKNIENLYTDQCTNMYFMFDRCSSLKEINLKYFETSNVTDMRGMFSDCSSLKYLDLTSFDISKSEDCNYMMDTNTSTTIKTNPDLKAKFNSVYSGTKITWE